MDIEVNFETTLWRHRGRHHHEKYFFAIIWSAPFISEVKLKLCSIKIFKMVVILSSRQIFFLPEVILKVEYTRKIGISIADILRFWSTLQLGYWRRYINFKIWHTLWPGPVFYLHSSLLKLSKLWDPNFSFNYLKQIHFLSQSFENLLKQGT